MAEEERKPETFDARERRDQEVLEQRIAKTRTPEKVTPIEEQSLSPEYIYKTNQDVEDFNETPFEPIPKTRNTLSPPTPFKPQDTVIHEEKNEYKDLGLFQEQVRYIFDPAERSDQNVVKKPVSSLYESKMDDTQTDVPKVIRTKCKCKDGSTVMGYLDVRSGQKDCSPCSKKVFNNPNPYKNYQTKKKTPNFSGKSVPLRKQVGVSHFGDVDMKGCQTGNAQQTLEQRNKISTLNQVTNIDTQDSIGGSNVTKPQNISGLPISLYENSNTNVYGV